MNSWTREKLYNLGIFELRSLARDSGVRSPTSLKKDDLIEQILSIISGDKMPYVKKNNKGRPPKDNFLLTNIVNVFPEEKPATFDEPDVFNQFACVCSGNSFGESQSIKTEGFVFVCERGYGFLYENLTNLVNNVLISEQDIKKYKLATGDYVKCECKDAGNGRKVVVEILKVNDLEINTFLSEIEKDVKAIKPIDDACNEHKIGEKVCYIGSNTNLEKEIIKHFNNCKCDKILLNLNSLEEDYIYHSNAINLPVFVDVEQKYKLICLVIANADRCAKLGQHKVIFVLDMSFFANDLTTDGFVSQKVSIDTLNKLKKQIASCKLYDNKGGSTIIYGLNNQDFNSQIIIPELSSLANTIHTI